jgi:hypothetical protein
VQCGCACVECTLATGESSTDLARCNDQTLGADCIKRDESKCGPEYSSDKQIIWCKVPTPSAWPPLFDVSNALQYSASAGDGTGQVDLQTEFLYTSAGQEDSTFVAGVMDRFVRQPNLEQALADPRVLAGIQVWRCH